jgi:hypothetical protein
MPCLAQGQDFMEQRHPRRVSLLKGTSMVLKKRELYLSSNGDPWYLAREDSGAIVVFHEPNKSSGGTVSKLEVGEFLMRGNRGPQHYALLELISTLVDAETV